MSDHGTAIVGQWTELVAEVVRQILRADDPRLPAVLAKYSNGQGGFQGALLKSDLEVALLSPKKEPELLLLLKSVAVSGVEKFVAKDYLATANVGWTGGNFKKLFLNKVEENVADTTVAVHRLEQSLPDAQIMAKLGERIVIKLAHFFELLKRQSNGEEGVLLVDGYANVAYIEGNDGNIWAVGAYWSSEDLGRGSGQVGRWLPDPFPRFLRFFGTLFLWDFVPLNLWLSETLKRVDESLFVLKNLL